MSLPPEADQRALGAELSDLLRRVGPRWLLEAPVLLAREADFPDGWRADTEGAAAMLRRLLARAGPDVAGH